MYREGGRVIESEVERECWKKCGMEREKEGWIETKKEREIHRERERERKREIEIEIEIESAAAWVEVNPA